MMMERAKTAPAPSEPSAEKTTAAAAVDTATTTPTPATTTAGAEERVRDLERRLGMLGGESSAPLTAEQQPQQVVSVPGCTSEAAAGVEPAISVEASSSSFSKQPAKPPPPVAAAPKKNNPLLARIMAAQERARHADEKQKQEEETAAAAAKKQEEEYAAAEARRIQAAQKALQAAAGVALEAKQDRILMELEGKGMAAATAAPTRPTVVSLPPPPSFDALEFQQHQQQPPPPPPPSFAAIEQRMMAPPPPSTMAPPSMMAPPPPSMIAPPPAPSAPAMADEQHGHGHLEGITLMAPPPPNFTVFEQQQQQSQSQQEQQSQQPSEEDGVFDFDLDGNPLSPDERNAMMDEQRRLYESIMSENAANEAAIARANADAFDNRSSNAAVAAMTPGAANSHVSAAESYTRAMDQVGRAAAGGVDADAEAAAAAQRAEDGGATTAGGDLSSDAAITAAAGQQPRQEQARRHVSIGGGQTVALHGQERTKAAIKDGTAILVQCLNCQNWMQVTESATLMFCPVCQVVSPVIKQNEVLTKEEAIQLTSDRRMAERMQAEAYKEGDTEGDANTGGGYFSSLFSSSSAPAAAAAATTAAATASSSSTSPSWWNRLSSVVSYGVAEQPGEMSVTRPPGASSTADTAPPSSVYPGQRRGGNQPALAPPSTSSSSGHEEMTGLLRPTVDGGSSDANEHNLPAGRIAEQKPLFSCIADSVAGAASAVWATGSGDGEDNVHGVDSSSFLAVTTAGRGVGSGAGNYSQLDDEEE